MLSLQNTWIFVNHMSKLIIVGNHLSKLDFLKNTCNPEPNLNSTEGCLVSQSELYLAEFNHVNSQLETTHYLI